MTTLQYVKQKGTCVVCKQKDEKKGAIGKGELYWEVQGGKFPMKFHFECYAPKEDKKWPAEKLTEEFLNSVKELVPEDQLKAMAIFEGQEDFVPYRNQLTDQKENPTEGKTGAKRKAVGPSNHRSAAAAEGEQCLAGKTFVLAGTLTGDKNEVTSLIMGHGGKVTGSVSGKTSYLVKGAEAGEAKILKAEKFNCPIIDEDELNNLISANKKPKTSSENDTPTAETEATPPKDTDSAESKAESTDVEIMNDEEDASKDKSEDKPKENSEKMLEVAKVEETVEVLDTKEVPKEGSEETLSEKKLEEESEKILEKKTEEEDSQKQPGSSEENAKEDVKENEKPEEERTEEKPQNDDKPEDKPEDKPDDKPVEEKTEEAKPEKSSEQKPVEESVESSGKAEKVVANELSAVVAESA